MCVNNITKGNSGYANASQCYFERTLTILFCSIGLWVYIYLFTSVYVCVCVTNLNRNVRNVPTHEHGVGGQAILMRFRLCGASKILCLQDEVTFS